MGNKSKKDLKIFGSGSSSGGKYNTVSIMGEGRIDGDVDCVKFKINGEGTLDGNLKAANNVSIMGEGRLSGDVDCANLKIYGEGELGGNLKAADTVSIKGETEIKGNLKAKNVKIMGEIEVNGEIFADKAKITGNISAGGDCNAELFDIDGGFTIEGLLNADILKINPYWPCKAREIGGAEITVKKGGKLSFLGLKNIFMPSRHSELTADIIEGDDIYLENTSAKVVRGNNITLGSGCKIELAEYRNNFKQEEGSEVGTHKKI